MASGLVWLSIAAAWVIGVAEEGGAEDAEGEEEAHGEAEEQRGADGVGDEHGVHVPATAFLQQNSPPLYKQKQ